MTSPGKSISDIANDLCKYFDIQGCRLSLASHHTKNSLVSDVGICAGSGGGLFESVLNLKADLLVTGEMGHHQVLAANKKGMSVCLFEHSNTERGYLKDKFQKILKKALAQENLQHVEIIVSEKDKEPCNIFQCSQ